MADTRYELRYLPLFYEDLEDKVLHIVSHTILTGKDDMYIIEFM